MDTIVTKYGKNPKLFRWDQTVKSIYHNLGDRASDLIVHFAIDIKSAMKYAGNRQPDYKNGLVVDPALEIDILSSYPKEDREDLSEFVFFRGFCFDSDNVEVISNLIYEYFFDEASYIWVNGKMIGGLCFPQKQESEDEYPPLKEQLSDFVCIKL